MTPQAIMRLAEDEGWLLIDHQVNIKMISFAKDDVRINVYYSTMTVGTCLDHPRQGRTQLFRKDVTAAELALIFWKPRIHSGKGYKRRKTGLKANEISRTDVGEIEVKLLTRNQKATRTICEYKIEQMVEFGRQPTLYAQAFEKIVNGKPVAPISKLIKIATATDKTGKLTVRRHTSDCYGVIFDEKMNLLCWYHPYEGRTKCPFRKGDTFTLDNIGDVRIT